MSEANAPITLLSNKKSPKVTPIYKKTLVILLLDFILLVAAFSVAQGGFPPEFFPTRGQASVFFRPTADENAGSPNVEINNLAFFNDSGRLFQAEKEIRVECHITQSRVEKPYEVVIKTDKEEILRKTIEPAKNEQNFILSAVYVPNDIGLRPVACRADFGNTLEESDERDNRMVKYLMIF